MILLSPKLYTKVNQQVFALLVLIFYFFSSRWLAFSEMLKLWMSFHDFVCIAVVFIF